MGVESKCVIKVTAPRETAALASVFAQLSNVTSNCAVFGHMTYSVSINPDIMSDATNGMVPDAIVFRAAKDDAAANELFGRLSNQIKLVRSYEPPRVDYLALSGGYGHTLWLQFGTNVKWNSEMR